MCAETGFTGSAAGGGGSICVGVAVDGTSHCSGALDVTTGVVVVASKIVLDADTSTVEDGADAGLAAIVTFFVFGGTEDVRGLTVPRGVGAVAGGVTAGAVTTRGGGGGGSFERFGSRG